jgi:creatinine amidohydrolase
MIGRHPVFRQDGLGIKLLTQDLNPAGALGDASRATAGLGERLLDHAAGQLAALLTEVHRLDLDRWLCDAAKA